MDEYFLIILGYFSPILHKTNEQYGYSLDAPGWGAPNEYPQYIVYLYREIRNIISELS